MTTTTEQTIEQPEATHVNTRACPSWCVHHDREDSKHAEDRYTRHCAEDVVVTMREVRAAWRPSRSPS